jgi:hypothetical protein
MQIEAIGAVVILCGLIGWFAGPRVAIPLFIASTLLNAAAALILTSLGGANIQPAHLLLCFLVLAAIATRGVLHRAGAALIFPAPGFWLVLTAAYAMLSAFFLPRIFADTTYVFAIARTELGPGIISMPLGPTSGNITQAIYFLGDVVCFLLFFAYGSRPEGLKTTINAAIAVTAINLCFAAIDLGSYDAGLGDVLAVIRNGNYRMLDDTAVLGFKRIVGSFTEASTFAYFTAGFFAFCTSVSIDGIRPRLTVPLALLSGVALVFSTSSTGYAAGSGFIALFFARSLLRVLSGPVRRTTLIAVAVLPLVVGAGLIGLRLDRPLWQTVNQVVDASIFDKMTSSSGIERAKWNEQALVNFADTHGLGAGDGSVRASSFPIAVLGNIGIFGGLTYGIFLLQLLAGRRDRWQHPFPAACQRAARWACLTQLIGASVAGSFIDLGLPFFIFAGLACAGPEPVRAARPMLTPTLATIPEGS